jgi:nucleotidyltransferase/DNA polymerase involved in DNA repair
MKNETEQVIELFCEYAFKRLENHQRELTPPHHPISRGSADFIKLSRQQHRQLFKAELAGKINDLINVQNKFIKSELKEISKSLIEKLN